MTLCFVSFAAVSVGQLLIALHSGSQIFPLFLPLPPTAFLMSAFLP